jgi:polysaccharide export outer membrane protein
VKTTAAILALLLTGPAAAQEQPLPAVARSCHTEYVIGPEDVLDIAVWGNAEISRTVPVRPDGRISLPLVNDILAAGFTPMELREKLMTSLAAFVATPNVSVIVREVHSFKVTVIGEVKTPGRYELRTRSTVLDVLALAGGPTDYAERERMVVVRQAGASTEEIPFSFRRGQGRALDNFCVAPGDVLLVP